MNEAKRIIVFSGDDSVFEEVLERLQEYVDYEHYPL